MNYYYEMKKNTSPTDLTMFSEIIAVESFTETSVLVIIKSDSVPDLSKYSSEVTAIRQLTPEEAATSTGYSINELTGGL